MATFGNIPDDVVRQYVRTGLTLPEGAEFAATEKRYKDSLDKFEKLEISIDEDIDRIVAHSAFYTKVWPRLKFLSLDEDIVDQFDERIAIHNFPRLQSLVFYGDYGTNLGSIVSLLENTPELKYFVFYNTGLPIPSPIYQKYKYSLVGVSTPRFSEALLECENLEYLSIANIEEKELILLSQAPFIPNLKYLDLTLVYPEGEKARGHIEADRMGEHPEAIAIRQINFLPLLQACEKLRFLILDGSFPQIRVISSLLTQPEICPKLTVLRLYTSSHVYDYPLAHLEGLKKIVETKKLNVLKFGPYAWPKGTLDVIKHIKYFYLFGTGGRVTKGFHHVSIVANVIYVGGEIGCRFKIKLVGEVLPDDGHSETREIEITDY